jgi:hypothetical protein
MKFLVIAFLFMGAVLMESSEVSAATETAKVPEDPALARFTPEQQKKLRAGEEVYEPRVEEATTAGGKKKFTAAAMIIINAPIEQCFKMFCDFDKQYLYFPQITKTNVISSSGNRYVIYKELDYRVMKIKYTHILTVDPQIHRVDFATDPSGVNDVKFSQGFFQFQKIDDKRTLFTYGLTKLDPGIQVPEFIQRYMTSRDLPKMVVNLKKWIESGGTWKK